MNPHRLRAYLLLLIVAVIWGIAGPVIKLTLKGLAPDIFLLYRFFLSSLIALPFFAVYGIKISPKPKILLMTFLYAFLNSTVTLGLLFWGTNKTSLLDMSLISIFAPLLIILGGFFFLKERITSRERIGIAIAFLGSFLIIFEPLLRAKNGTGQLSGNLLIFASLSAGAASGVLLKKLLRENISAFTLSSLSFLVGFISLLPIVLLRYSSSYLINLISTTPLSFHLGVVYMAVFSGTIAYTLVNLAQKTIELSEAALFSYLHPIFSAILAIFLLGDKLSIPVIIGSIITFSGVFVAEIKANRLAIGNRKKKKI